MKKLISLILSFTILLSAFSINVFAAEELSLAVSTAYDSQDSLYYNISAWHKFDKSECGNSVVIEMVKKSEGFSDLGIAYIDETIIDEYGAVRFDFKVKDYNEYTIRFTSGDFKISNVKKDVKLLAETGADGLGELLTKVINLSDSEKMISQINSDSYNLNLNTKYLNELTDKSVVTSGIMSKKDEITVENYVPIYDSLVIFNYLKQQTDLAKVIDMIEYYDGSYFKIKDQQEAKGIYPTYQSMSKEVKNKVISSVKNVTDTDFNVFRKKFNDAVILTALKNYDKKALDKVFNDNLDLLEFSDYTSLSDTDKGEILEKLINDNSIKSVETLKTQYDLYKTGSENVPDLPPQEEDTGSAGGGGKPSSVVTVDKNLTENEQSETVDLRTDFTDLNNHEWAREAIEDLAYKKIVSGKGDRQFFPQDNIKREEFIKILVLAFGLYDENATCSYTDIPSDNWAYSYVASGTKAGLTVGYEDGSFGVGANISREDMAVMVHRLLVSIRNIDRITDLSKTFDDMELVSGYASNSVKMLLNAGIVQGDNNKFNPKNNTTRAEAAQLIYNILKGEN